MVLNLSARLERTGDIRLMEKMKVMEKRSQGDGKRKEVTERDKYCHPKNSCSYCIHQ